MNDKDKRQVIDFDEGLDDLPSDDEWETEREGHGGSSNINLLETINSTTQRKKGKEDDSDNETFNGVEVGTHATEPDFKTFNSRTLELNIVGVGSSTNNIGVSTSGTTNNLSDSDATDASLGHSEGNENEAGFSLHCMPTEDLF